MVKDLNLGPRDKGWGFRVSDVKIVLRVYEFKV
jgi:hypothetical protein